MTGYNTNNNLPSCSSVPLTDFVQVPQNRNIYIHHVTSRSRSWPGHLRLNVWTIELYRANCSNGADTAFHRTYSCNKNNLIRAIGGKTNRTAMWSELLWRQFLHHGNIFCNRWKEHAHKQNDKQDATVFLNCNFYWQYWRFFFKLEKLQMMTFDCLGKLLPFYNQCCCCCHCKFYYKKMHLNTEQ